MHLSIQNKRAALLCKCWQRTCDSSMQACDSTLGKIPTRGKHLQRVGITFGITIALLAVVILSALSVSIILWASSPAPAYANGDEQTQGRDQVSNAPRAGKKTIDTDCEGEGAPGSKTKYDGSQALCEDYLTNDPEVWLPLWRWKGMASIITDSQADTEFTITGIFQAAGNLINSVTNALSLIPLLLASILWHVTAFLIKFVMEPQFFNDLQAYAFESTETLWKEFKDLMGLSGDENNVGALSVILVISIFIAIRQLVLPAAGKSVPWFQFVTTLLRTFALLAIAFHLAAGADAAGQAKDFLQKSIIQTVQTGVTPLLTGVNKLTQARGKEVLTTCDAYTATLENIYRGAVDKAGDPRRFARTAISAYTTGGTGTDKATPGDKGAGILTDAAGEAADKESTIRKEIPILMSRLWERFYYQPVGLMQFSDNIAARRGTCFLFEWQSNRTGSDINKILKLSAELKPLSGNKSLSIAAGNVADGKDAEAVFSPIISPFNVQPGRVYMLLAAACEMLPVDTVQRATDSRNLTIETKDDTDETKDDTEPPWMDPAFKGLQGATNPNRAIQASLVGFIGRITGSNPGGKTQNEAKITSTQCTKWLGGVTTHKSQKGQGVEEENKNVGLNQDGLLTEMNLTAWSYNRQLTSQLAAEDNTGQKFKTRTARAHQVIKRLQGYEALQHAVYAVGAFISSVILLWVMLGLSLGVIVAQFVLAMIILFAPLLLIFMALPTRGASKLTRTILRLFFMSLLAYVVFFFLLMIILLTVHILIGLVDFATRGNLLIQIIATSLVPLLAMYVIQSITKMLGINANFASPIGMADFTSGLAASGMSIGDPIAYARGFVHQTQGAVGAVGGLALNGIKGVRTVTYDADQRKKKNEKDHGGKGWFFGKGMLQAVATAAPRFVGTSIDEATKPGLQKHHEKRDYEVGVVVEGTAGGNDGENGGGATNPGAPQNRQNQPSPQGHRQTTQRIEGDLHSVGNSVGSGILGVAKGAGRAVNHLTRDIGETMKREGHDNVFSAAASVVSRNLSNEAKRNKEEQIGMPNVPGMGAAKSPFTAVKRSIANNADDSAYYEGIKEYRENRDNSLVHQSASKNLQKIDKQRLDADRNETERQEALANEIKNGHSGPETDREARRVKLEEQLEEFNARQEEQRKNWAEQQADGVHVQSEEDFNARQEQARQNFQKNRSENYKELGLLSPEDRQQLDQEAQEQLRLIGLVEKRARQVADEAMRNREKNAWL